MDSDSNSPKSLEKDLEYVNTDPNSRHISLEAYLTRGITFSTTAHYWLITSNHNSPLCIWYGTYRTSQP
jgi:hypothetical protein